MSTRQYIGARYVPKFATPIQWDNSRSYEALEVVTYNNNSYTSKKPVPIGINISNTEYWVVSSNYSAQVEEYRREVEDMKGSKADYEKSVIVIGDSYGTSHGGSATIEYPYPGLVQGYLGFDNEHFIANCENGAGFCNGSFYNQLDVISRTDADNVSDIYVLGGWNDIASASGVSEAAFITAIVNFKQLANRKYKNAKLHLCFISGDIGGYNAGLNTTLGWYKNAVKYGYAFHDNMQWCMHDASLMNGNGDSHPNQNGMVSIAEALTQVILTGDCTVELKNVISESDISGYGTFTYNGDNVTLIVTEELVNEKSSLNFYVDNNALIINMNTSVTFNGGNVAVLNVPTKIVRGYADNVCIDVPATYVFNDGTVKVIPTKLVFANGIAYIKPIYTPTSGSDMTALTATVYNLILGTAAGIVSSKF